MPPRPGDQPSFMESYRFVRWAMQFPALSVMVYLRRDIGYRLLNPLVLIAVFGLLFVIAILAMPGNDAARPVDLAIFAALGFLSGIVQRIRRWWELTRKPPQHSYYIGSSPFNYRWIPDSVRSNRRAARFLDPLFCAGIGLALFHFSHVLGGYLVFAGFCLRAYEDMIFTQQRNRDLDLMDDLIGSEQQAATIEQYEQQISGAQKKQQPTPGVPTGLGEDIKEQVKEKEKYENN